MCPLRFILVFLSAALAGYFAWRSVRSSEESDTIVSVDSSREKAPSNHKQSFDVVKVIQGGFWVFVDMASGRYLWRNLREINCEKKSL